MNIEKNPTMAPEPSTPQQSKSSLETFDNMKFSMFHIITIIVAGAGFLTDSYDLFCISLLTKMIGRIYYPDIEYFSQSQCLEIDTPPTCGSQFLTLSNYLNETMGTFTQNDLIAHIPSAMPSNVDAAIKGVALVGTFCGQIIFGYLGDKYGRKPIFVTTLSFLIIAALGSGLSFGSTPTTVVATLCFFRFWLGVGVGGEYPNVSVMVSEFSTKNQRGQMISAIFSMQGIGILLGSIITLIVSAFFKGSPHLIDYVWRIILMFGSVPALFTMYSRLNVPETPRFTLLIKNEIKDPQNTIKIDIKDPHGTTNNLVINSVESQSPLVPKSPTPDLPKITYRQFLSQYGSQLFGCACSWFLIDIAYYSQNLYQADIFTNIGWIDSAYKMDGITEAIEIAKAQIYIALASTVPGYFMTVFTIEKMGRIKIQYMGFFMMTLFMGIIAGDYKYFRDYNINAFICLYALCFFFANWGPNQTTFVIGSELFDTSHRSTAQGISAATGKAGAIIGVFGFGAIQKKYGIQSCLIALTVINFLGLFTTWFVPETQGKSLEELSELGKKKPMLDSNV
jgi:PHS family inorganic phosphate transporter-like MFS transporter